MWNDKDIGALTGFVAVVLGFYSGANVMQYYTNQRFGNKGEPQDGDSNENEPEQGVSAIQPSKRKRRD